MDYKAKYLKSIDPESGKIYAFPDGIPGYESIEKIHLMGHSMGALTSREFQYLLKVKQFEMNSLGKIESPDPSFILSMTMFAGAINGSLAPNNHGANWDKKERCNKFNPRSKWLRAFKLCIFS